MLPNLKTIITEDEIKDAIRKISAEYGKIYENQQLTIVVELSGVFVFLADLIRELPIDTTIQFVTKLPEVEEANIKIDLGIQSSLKDKNVLILCDVFYKGNGLKRLYDIVLAEEPKNVRVLSLINKLNSEKNQNIQVESLFTLDEMFLVGYGLTHNESYRGLKSIYQMEK